jgi:hypothetical protein
MINYSQSGDVEALAEHIADAGFISFAQMNEFLRSRAVTVAGGSELTGEHVNQAHVGLSTTLFASVSDEYVQIVHALFNRWPVMLMIGDPTLFGPGEAPWWVTWSGGPTLLREGILVAARPAVNRDVHAIADTAKHQFAVVTKEIAETQYRIAELAGTYRLDEAEAFRLQHSLFQIWEQMYFGTLCAVRDVDTPDSTWDVADNTYSDGRQIVHKIRVEAPEDSECSWEHNRYLLGDGAVAEHPRGTVTYIAPLNPDDEVCPSPRSSTFDEIRERLRPKGDD